jgi:hypothetical protein
VRWLVTTASCACRLGTSYEQSRPEACPLPGLKKGKITSIVASDNADLLFAGTNASVQCACRLLLAALTAALQQTGCAGFALDGWPAFAPHGTLLFELSLKSPVMVRQLAVAWLAVA